MKFVIPNAKQPAIGIKYAPGNLATLNKLAQQVSLDKADIINSFVINNINPYTGRQGLTPNYTKDQQLGLSSLGTPVYTDLTLLGCSYTDSITVKLVELKYDLYFSGDRNTSINGNDSGVGSTFYLALETVLITVNQSIRVVKTEIQGRNGTVKEYIGADDMKISINGIITGQNGVYPRDTVRKLKRWLDAPVAKKVVAWWLGNLGVDMIVVESYSFPQTQGGYSYQTFSISAVSDAPVELRITQGNV